MRPSISSLSAAIHSEEPPETEPVVAAEPSRVPRSAANAAGRKIPHYGKYSYLAFTEGSNREKGTWEPVASPAVHRFDGGDGR